MSAAEMGAGYRRLYAQLLSDGAIARRIRNKLAHFGALPRVKRETFTEAARIVLRLLWRGIARGGPARAWHFLRSLPLARPRLVPLAVNDWIAALAMRSYAERNLLGRRKRALGARDAFLGLRAALRGWRRRGKVRVALRESQPELAVRVTGRLDPRLARRLARHLRAALEGSSTRVVLAIEGRAGAELERLSRALARYGDRVGIVLGRGVEDLLRLA
jgi:hypothetical protein